MYLEKGFALYYQAKTKREENLRLKRDIRTRHGLMLQVEVQRGSIVPSGKGGAGWEKEKGGQTKESFVRKEEKRG